MNFDFERREFVRVTSSDPRFGHLDRLIDRSCDPHILYCVQFPRSAVCYFETCEIEKIGQHELPVEYKRRRCFIKRE